MQKSAFVVVIVFIPIPSPSVRLSLSRCQRRNGSSFKFQLSSRQKCKSCQEGMQEKTGRQAGRNEELVEKIMRNCQFQEEFIFSCLHCTAAIFSGPAATPPAAARRHHSITFLRNPRHRPRNRNSPVQFR